MNKPFKRLLAQMSPEAQADVSERVNRSLSEMHDWIKHERAQGSYELCARCKVVRDQLTERMPCHYLHGYESGTGWKTTMQSKPSWRSRVGDVFSWLAYKLDELLR